MIKKFCKNNDFKFLSELSDKDKKSGKDLLLSLSIEEKEKANNPALELFFTYFFKEKEVLDYTKWQIKSSIGKPGKDGSAYIIVNKKNPEKEYVIKMFRAKKSFNKVRNEVRFQTIASLYGISPKIYEYGAKPNPYIIMDKMNQGTILDVIDNQGGILSEEQQKQIIDIYRILDKIKIYHNDYNLLNFMINDDKVYIIDFGFSKKLEKGKTNFTTLQTSLFSMTGYKSVLSQPPKLLLSYATDDIKKQWSSLPTYGIKLPPQFATYYDKAPINRFPIGQYYAILYLSHTFSNECVVMPHSEPKPVFYKNDLLSQWSQITLTYNQKKKELFYPTNYWDYIKNCYNNPIKRFIMIPLTFHCLDENNHSNFLIYDKKLDTLERFEPNGFTVGDCYNKVDNLIVKLFKKNFSHEFTYFKPLDFCPLENFQYIATHQAKPEEDSGYCLYWSLWYAHLRLLNPDVDKNILIKKAINSLKRDKIHFNTFIDRYSRFISNITAEVISSKNPEETFYKLLKEK